MCSWICAKHMCVNMCPVEVTTYYLLLPPFRHPLTFHAPEGPPGRQQEAPQEPPFIRSAIESRRSRSANILPLLDLRLRAGQGTN